MAAAWLEIDGAQGEGGGQILRSSLALSLLTGRKFHLRNIRAGRPRPGLQPQHLMSVQAAATISQAQVQGAAKGSMELFFEPGTVQPGTYHFAIGTAGATGLVLHTVYLPLALAGAPSSLAISGGTHVPGSPSFEFLDITWREYLRILGISMRLRLLRPGFYPRGGGTLRVQLEPCVQLQPLQLLELQPPRRARLHSVVANLPIEVAQRQARRAHQRLAHTGLEVESTEEAWDNGPGTVLTIVLDTAPVPTVFFALGERGKRAERVADEAADQVLTFLQTQPLGVDPHSADQLLLPLAFAPGRSCYRVAAVTRHLTTNLAVVRQFVERDLHCDAALGQPGQVCIA
jgi:RNA 3'-phosphate cyclase